jgi:hypothetical protein
MGWLTAASCSIYPKILALAGSMSGQQRLDLSECYEMLEDP